MFVSFRKKRSENILLIQGFEEVSYLRAKFPLEQTNSVNFFFSNTHTGRRILHGLAPSDCFHCTWSHSLCTAMIKVSCHSCFIAATRATRKNENKRMYHEKENALMLYYKESSPNKAGFGQRLSSTIQTTTEIFNNKEAVFNIKEQNVLRPGITGNASKAWLLSDCEHWHLWQVASEMPPVIPASCRCPGITTHAACGMDLVSSF